MFVAAAFQLTVNPMMHKTRPCDSAVEGSSGKASSKIAARGIAEPELICERIILPALGNFWARTSPIFPPHNAPIDVATAKSVQRNAVVLWEKPMSSNHMGANARDDQGNDPETP